MIMITIKKFPQTTVVHVPNLNLSLNLNLSNKRASRGIRD